MARWTETQQRSWMRSLAVEDKIRGYVLLLLSNDPRSFLICLSRIATDVKQTPPPLVFCDEAIATGARTTHGDGALMQLGSWNLS